MTTSWTFFRDCLQLLYWIYFKPFTHHAHCRTIHPNLDSDTNPFSLRADFATNPALAHYANQVWALTLGTPAVFILITGFLYSLIRIASWSNFIGFLIGWIVGLSLAHKDTKNGLYMAAWFFLSILVLFLIAFVIIEWTPNLKELVNQVVHFLGNQPFNLSKLIKPSSYAIQALAFVVVLNCWVFDKIPSQVFLSVLGGLNRFVLVFITFSGCSCILLILINLNSSLLDIFALGTITTATGVAISLPTLNPEQDRFNTVGFLVLFSTVLLTSVAMSSSTLSISARIPVSIISSISSVFFIMGLFRVWFWLPELVVMLGLKLLIRRDTTNNVLNYLPPLGDELIRLPLPFMTGLLVQSYRHHPTATRQKLEYLLTSTNQQRVAARSQEFIALEGCIRCADLAAIAAIVTEFDWVPIEDAHVPLAQVFAISQAVRDARQATSAYRQGELLATPLKSLQALLNRLSSLHQPQVIAVVGAIVDRWTGLLTTAQETLHSQALKSGEVPQVYVAGPALDPTTTLNRFKGRQDLFRELEALVLQDQPPVLMLYGQRRTGKTSTLRVLPHRLGSRLVPLLVDLQGIAGLTTTLEGLVTGLATAMQTAASQLPQPVTLPAFALAPGQEPLMALQAWFTSIERLVSHKQLVLCLDEFERLDEVMQAMGNRAPLNFFRSLMQHNRRWILLFSGSHALDELAPHWSDCLIGTRALNLSYLHESEARDLIQHPVPEFPDLYAPAAVAEIVRLTHCQPFLVQLVCYELVEQANRRGVRRVDLADVQAVVPTVLQTGMGYFDELWRQTLSESERAVLTELVQGTGAAAADPLPVKRLLRRELLTAVAGGYQVQVPLVECYVRDVLSKE